MHTLAWVAWVSMVMAIALTTTNPLYLAIVLLGVLLVAVLAPRTATAVTGFRALLVFGVTMFVLSLGIAAINGSYGQHILFTIPTLDVPGWMGGLRLGGPVSGEGLVAAAIRGLAILCVLLAFAVFNGAVSPHRVLRLAPAALFHAGLVVTVGLTLLPSSIEDLRRVREMQALRGAPTRRRNLTGLVVPSVIGGLERSMRLAEAMEARGYAASPPAHPLARLAGIAAAPVLLVTAWAWFAYPSLRVYAAIALVVAVAGVSAWTLSAARRRQSTRFHEEPVSRADQAAILVAAVGVVAVVLCKAGGWGALGYNPFAGLPWPRFTPAGALIAASTAWPALRIAFGPAPRPTPAANDQGAAAAKPSRREAVRP